MNPLLPPGVTNPQPPVQQDGPLVACARTLERAPGYFVTFLLGLLRAALEDPVTTALTVASAALALYVGSWLVGVAAFFFGYVLVRAINNVAASIAALAGALGRDVAGAIHTLRPPAQDHITTYPPSL